MLRLVPPASPLSTAEAFALGVLLDASRVVVAEAGVSDATDLRVVGDRTDTTWAAVRARAWGMAARNDGVEVDRSLLALVADACGAVAEQRSTASDRYGRVPPDDNALVRTGEEKDPVVSRAGVALRQVAVAAAGRRPMALLAPWPHGKRWAVAMTHDLDVVSQWPAFGALRIVELLSRGEIARAARVVSAAFGATLSNPVWSNAQRILTVEHRLGVRSTWFVIAGTPTLASIRAGDVTYAPETSLARQVLDAVRDQRHEIGLHGSFASYTNRAEFVTQRERLASVVGSAAAGVRQHFIRMRPGASHAVMAAAGFTYDSTYGFSERNAFRIGVADVAPAWSDAEQRELPIDVAPFVWMDRALSKYQALEDPQDWIADAMRTAAICREVDGLWTGIWHPNMTDALGFPGAPAAFENLCTGLMANAPWAATLSEAVGWRRARRATRGAGVEASGVIRLKVGDVTAPITLEDAQGRSIRHVPA